MLIAAAVAATLDQ